MRLLINVFFIIIASSCVSKPSRVPTNIKNVNFDVNLSDFDDLISPMPIKYGNNISIQPAGLVKMSDAYKNKWVVLNVMATWCGYSLQEIVYFENEIVRKGLSNVQEVNLTLEAQNSKDPKRDQSANITLDFVNGLLSSSKYDVSLTQTDFYYLPEMNFKDLKKLNVRGNKIFETMTGYPFQFIFNPKGKLVFIGHFTNTVEADNGVWQKPYERHFDYIKSLVESK